MLKTDKGIIKPIVYVGIMRDQKLLLVDYVQAPNPEKKGWWIPAPELQFGENPADRAQKVVREMGFAADKLRLFDTESFVLPGGWHLIFHFICEVNGDVADHPNIKSVRWVAAGELAAMTDMAHGKWELSLARKYLERGL